MQAWLGVPLFLAAAALCTFFGAAVAGLAALGRLLEDRARPDEPPALTSFILRDTTSAIAAWILGAFLWGGIALLVLDSTFAGRAGATPPLLARLLLLVLDLGVVVAGLLLWKRLAEAAPRSYCITAAVLILPLYLVLYPLRRPLGAALERLYPPAARLAALLVADDLREMAASGGGAPRLDQDGREMIERVLLLGETVVREIMVPRIDMVALELSMPLPAIRSLVREKRHSRLPVYRDSVDNIVGFLHIKDLLGEPPASLATLLRPVPFVPETKRVGALLTEMRERRSHLAIVVDEYGGTAGLVTLEDVIEEVVGEIQDESDKEQPLFTVLDDGSFRVDAKVDLDELNERLQVTLPADDYDTLGGYLYGLAGKIPAPGERFQDSGLEFVIRSVRGRRITQVLVRPVPALKSEGE